MKYLVQYCSIHDKMWLDFNSYFTRWGALRAIMKALKNPKFVPKWRLIELHNPKGLDLVLYEFERRKIFNYR